MKILCIEALFNPYRDLQLEGCCGIQNGEREPKQPEARRGVTARPDKIMNKIV